MKAVLALALLATLVSFTPTDALADDADQFCTQLKAHNLSQGFECENFKGAYFGRVGITVCARMIGLMQDHQGDLGVLCMQAIQGKLYSTEEERNCLLDRGDVDKVNCLKQKGTEIPAELRACPTQLAQTKARLASLSGNAAGEDATKVLSELVRNLEAIDEGSSFCATLKFRTGNAAACDPFKGSYFYRPASLVCSNLGGLKGPKGDAGIECLQGIQNRVYSRTEFMRCSAPRLNAGEMTTCLAKSGAEVPAEFRTCRKTLAQASTKLSSLSGGSPKTTEAMKKELTELVHRLETESPGTSKAR